MRRSYFTIIPVFLYLTGCTGLISQPSGNVPVEEPTQSTTTSEVDDNRTGNSEDEMLDLATLNADLPQPGPSPGNAQPAVMSLLDEAVQQYETGRTGAAAATIERAIRLEPNNAYLWSRLAQIRLQENNWQQAYVLANKSNSLARSNRTLQRLNWGIIEQAKRQQGDLAAAENARSRIRMLSGN